MFEYQHEMKCQHTQTFSCSFMPSDNSNSHNWCDLMKIIISKCVGNKFEDYVKWYMKIWINFCLLATSTHCTVIVCKYVLCVCVCFTKIFNKHLSMSEQKFCTQPTMWINFLTNIQSSIWKRENWTNDTQMCCWKFIFNFCSCLLYDFRPIYVLFIALWLWMFNAYMDGIVNSFTQKKIPFSTSSNLCQFYYM